MAAENFFLNPNGDCQHQWLPSIKFSDYPNSFQDQKHLGSTIFPILTKIKFMLWMCWQVLLCCYGNRCLKKQACLMKHFSCMGRILTSPTGLPRPATKIIISRKHASFITKARAQKRAA